MEFEMPKETRARKAFDTLVPWKKCRVLDSTKDRLAFRLYILESEGRPTLVNVIRGEHNLSKAY